MATRRRTHSAEGEMDRRLIGLFSCGTSSNLMSDAKQETLWKRHGPYFLEWHWPHGYPCWAEKCFGRPWEGVLPGGFARDD